MTTARIDPRPDRTARTTRPVTTGQRHWAARQLVRGRPTGEVTAALRARGVGPTAADETVRRVLGSAAFTAGQELAERLGRAEALLNAYAQLRELADTTVAEQHGPLDASRFLAQHYAANRPLVVRGLADAWPARERWTPGWLASVCGEAQVEVMAGRTDDPQYEVNSWQHKRHVRFADYVQHVEHGGPSNDMYLVANNGFLVQPAAEPLLADLGPLPPVLAPRLAPGSAFLWYGPSGTVTPLHHDLLNVLLVQLRGRKRVRLIAADLAPRVYNRTGVFSEVDAEHPDLVRQPRFRGVGQALLELGPGDALFIPVGWWHHVRSLEVSISVSFTGFAWPNHFAWDARPT